MHIAVFAVVVGAVAFVAAALASCLRGLNGITQEAHSTH